jgi:NTE family protein
VFEVLEAAGLPVGAVTGVSAGGLVAVLYGAGFSPPAIRDYIADTSLLEVWDAFADPTRRGLFGAEKIRARLRNAVGDKTFDDLRLPVTVVAVDMNAGREVYLNAGRLDEALLATMAIPGLFTPFLCDNKLLIDGGALNPLPVDVAHSLGPRILAVDVLHHQAPPDKPVQLFEARGPIHYAAEIGARLRLTEMLELGYQTAALMTKRLSEYNLQAYPPDALIQPEVGEIGLFAFDLAGVAYEKGREAAQAALPQLEALAHPRLDLPDAWTAALHTGRRPAKVRAKHSRPSKPVRLLAEARMLRPNNGRRGWRKSDDLEQRA